MSGRSSRSRRLRLLIGALAAALMLVIPAVSASASAAPAGPYQEPYRPQFHFTPAQNWMNDPNGLVYYQGEYHLFFQYNPFGNTWGNMSWGHAVSTRPRALEASCRSRSPSDGDELVFSGSAVVDYGQHAAASARRQNPPMVAIYTSARKPGTPGAVAGLQHRRRPDVDQVRGQPGARHRLGRVPRPEGVLVRARRTSGGWSVVMAAEHKVRLYSSPNLKDWTHLSDFGPASAIGGVWECPDLFPLAVDGDPAQDQVGDGRQPQPRRDRRRLGRPVLRRRLRRHAPSPPTTPATYTPPAGDVLAGLRGRDYGAWTTTGTAFGAGPPPVTLPGQQAASPASSASGSPTASTTATARTGTLTSPEFTISQRLPQLPRRRRQPPARPGTRATARRRPAPCFADFEGSDLRRRLDRDRRLRQRRTRRRHDRRPAAGQRLPGQRAGQHLHRPRRRDHRARSPRRRSPSTSDYINFLVGGGNHPYERRPRRRPRSTSSSTARSSRTATGQRHRGAELGGLERRRPAGQAGPDRDRRREHRRLGPHHRRPHRASPTTPASSASDRDRGQPARRRQGRAHHHRHRTARRSTGPPGTSATCAGKTAQIQIVDHNTGGWGHILADQFTFADAARAVADAARALARLRQGLLRRGHLQRRARRQAHHDRLDEQLAVRRRHPDRPWRSAMSVPRELALRTIDGSPQLVQQPVARARHAARPASVTPRTHRTIPRGHDHAARARQGARDRRRPAARHAPSTLGLKVRTGNGEETVIGYDAAAGELYVDRTQSGAVGLQPPTSPASSARRSPLRDGDGAPAHPRRPLLGRGLRRGRRAHDHRPGLPHARQRRPAALRRRRHRHARLARDPPLRSSWTPDSRHHRH